MKRKIQLKIKTQVSDCNGKSKGKAMDEKQNKALLEKRESKRKEGWGFGLLYACGMMEDSGWKKKEEGRRKKEEEEAKLIEKMEKDS